MQSTVKDLTNVTLLVVARSVVPPGLLEVDQPQLQTVFIPSTWFTFGPFNLVCNKNGGMAISVRRLVDNKFMIMKLQGTSNV